MNSNSNHGGSRKKKTNAIVKAMSLAVLVALNMTLTAWAAEPPKPEPGGWVNLALGCPVAVKTPTKAEPQQGKGGFAASDLFKERYRSVIEKPARRFCCLAAGAAYLGGRADASDAAANFARHGAPFLKKHCVQCHGNATQEGVRFDGTSPDFQDAATRTTWERVWRVIASGQMPPQEVPAPGSDEMIPVLDWIREQAASAAALARRDGDGNGARRLTSREQVRVWTDLLEFKYANHEPDLLRFLAQDPRSEHFINRGDKLLMQDEHVNRSLDLAERLLELVLPDPERPEPIS